MTYNIGDPDHIGVHNALALELQGYVDDVGIEVDLPPQRVLGDRQHVDDHNAMVAAIQALADGGGLSRGPTAAKLGATTGNCVKTSTIGDGTTGEIGQHYDIYKWTGSGTLAVAEAGVMEVVIVGGGAGSSGFGGAGGGHVNASTLWIDAATYTITVSGGSSGSGGSMSSITHDDFDVAKAGGGATSYQDSHGWRVKGGHGMYPGGSNHMDGDGHPMNYQNCGGGGGGAGGPGGAARSGAGGDGGDGYLTHITGSPLYFGAGGAACRTQPSQAHAGNGNAGLGGAAAHANGAINTGQGAGGQYGSNKSGGSGIVICRIAVDSGSFFGRDADETPRPAHAARVEDGVVTSVIVIPHLDDDDRKITEWCNSIGLPGEWLDTSYTGARRGRFAAVGDTYVDGEYVSSGWDAPTEIELRVAADIEEARNE